MFRVAAILLACAALTACNEDIKAQRAYVASQAAYKDCLNAHVGAPQDCETQRLVMESDRQAFQSLTRAIKPY